MIIQKLPYIIFRDYANHGYLTDNRNFGYDTRSRSCRKVGDLLMSKEGSVFYSVLTEEPQTLNKIVNRLCFIFDGTPRNTIYEDAHLFYQDLYNKGFIFCASEIDDRTPVPLPFSYQNQISVEIPSFPEPSFEYGTVWGADEQLTRIHLDVSSQCNEHCVHCYIPQNCKSNVMSEELFDDILKQCHEMRVLNITISGGEPMMNPNIISILEKCHERNFSVNLLTNLTLLTDEILKAITSNPLVSIQTSLYSMDEAIHDAITRKKGSFRKTFAAIKKLWERNVPMQINCPITKHNYESFRDVQKWASSMNIDSDADYTLFGCYDGSKANLNCRLNNDNIRDIVKMQCHANSNIGIEVNHKMICEDDPICPVCKSSLCISNIGDVYPCEGWQSLKLGNLKEQALQEIWRKSPMVLHLRNLKIKDFPKCMSCQDHGYCSPCLIMNANENTDGDYMNINPYMCELAKIKRQCNETRVVCSTKS